MSAPKESTASITAWGDAAFGPVADISVLARRARAELDELEAALAAGNHVHAAGEAADVVILLHRLVGLAGRDLATEVDAKMHINRQRQWRPSGDGVGQHI